MHEKMRILVGWDASGQSRRALREAVVIAKYFSGFVKVVNVYGKGMMQKAETSVIEVKETLKQEQVPHEVQVILGANPAETLESIAKKENFELIVIGSRGLGNTMSMLLGSVSRHVVSNAHCNVLVVKNPQ